MRSGKARATSTRSTCCGPWPREPGTLEAWRARTREGRGANLAFDRFLDRIDAGFAHLGDAEVFARRLVEDMALALQASLMIRHAPPAMAEAFIAARIEGGMRGCYGSLPPRLSLDTIVERARVR